MYLSDSALFPRSVKQCAYKSSQWIVRLLGQKSMIYVDNSSEDIASDVNKHYNLYFMWSFRVVNITRDISYRSQSGILKIEVLTNWIKLDQCHGKTPMNSRCSQTSCVRTSRLLYEIIWWFRTYLSIEVIFLSHTKVYFIIEHTKPILYI